MSRTLGWFHCFAGIAGDMALGSLIDAGADPAEVRALLDRLPMAGWSMEVELVMRGGIGATKVTVVVADTPVVRTYAHITGLVDEARLPERVRNRAQATFAALAQAEGHLHRRPAAQVHFHEVGGVDAVIDVVGTCAAMEVLGIDEVWSSPVANGTGMVRSAHGMLPVPAPAVVELLRGAPTYGRDVPYELTTPTGAALLAATVTGWGPLPSMEIRASGFGAGTRDMEGLPNLVQFVVGDGRPSAGSARPEPGQPVMLLEVNVDDATGETLAHAVAALLATGAHDAWVTPIVMKKGRPAHTVSALVDPALADDVAAVLVAETGSLGIRGDTLQRWPSARVDEQVDVDGIPVRVKVGAGRVKVEHDDAARAARRTGLPLREVVSRAEEAWRRRPPSGPDGAAG